MGYGDISAENSVEQIVCILAMVMGVAAFAYGTSTFTNLLQNYDADNSKLNRNIEILNKIKKDHKLPLELYENVKRSLKFQFDNDIEDQTRFVQQLPQDLKHYLSLFVYEHIYQNIEYLKDRPIVYITWLCPLLTPMVINKD